MSAAISGSEALALIGAGVLFLNGLLTGVWKYAQIRASEQSTATAHPYVDIAHRASLLYSFAALLLARFAEISQLPVGVELAAVAFLLIFFVSAIGIYMLHGLLRDTDNQLRRPHRLGSHTVPGALVTAFMLALIVAEIGGFLVLFYGVIIAIFPL